MNHATNNQRPRSTGTTATKASATDTRSVDDSSIDPHREFPKFSEVYGEVFPKPTEPITNNTYKKDVGNKDPEPKFISVTFPGRAGLEQTIHLNPAKWKTLLFISQSEVTPRDALVGPVFASRSNANATLGTLLNLGLIRRLPSSSVKVIEFAITSAGRTAVSQIVKAGGVVAPVSTTQEK
jgi:hypothetical protein